MPTFEIFRAIEEGDVGKVRRELARGLDPNTQDTLGFTLLVHAVAQGHVEMVEMLLAAGADVNAKARIGVHALLVATEHRDAALARLLLDVGAPTLRSTRWPSSRSSFTSRVATRSTMPPAERARRRFTLVVRGCVGAM